MWTARLRFAARSLPVFLVTLLVACQCGPDGARQAEASLDDTAESLDFGLVAVGEAVERSLPLTSLGLADVEVQLSIEDSTGGFRLVDPIPSLVPANDTSAAVVAFAPTGPDVSAATLVIRTNEPDASRSTRRVLLSGQGAWPQLLVEPTRIELSATECPLGALSAVCQAQGVLRVSNPGQVPVRLTRVAWIVDGGGPVPSGLVATPALGATTLAPGGRFEWTLRWRPGPGTTASTLPTLMVEVESNAPEAPLTRVPVQLRAIPNGRPTACIEVVEVTQRVYEVVSGRPVLRPRGVSLTSITDPLTGRIRLKPGMKLTVSSSRTDPALEASAPCTVDPEGDTLTPAWAVLRRPTESSAVVSSPVGTTTSLEVDAIGTYELGLSVSDSLGQSAAATLTLDAIPSDDLVVQLSWQDGTNASAADLDLHLWTLEGEGGPTGGAPFCEQDCFVFNPSPALFDTARLDDDPRFLRDDQGTAGQLESIILPVVSSTVRTRFGVGVHYFAAMTSPAPTLRPQLRVRLRGRDLGPIQPVQPLSGADTFWQAAELVFEPGQTPSIVPVDRIVGVSSFDGTVRVCGP